MYKIKLSMHLKCLEACIYDTATAMYFIGLYVWIIRIDIFHFAHV